MHLVRRAIENTRVEDVEAPRERQQGNGIELQPQQRAGAAEYLDSSSESDEVIPVHDQNIVNPTGAPTLPQYSLADRPPSYSSGGEDSEEDVPPPPYPSPSASPRSDSPAQPERLDGDNPLYEGTSV